MLNVKVPKAGEEKACGVWKKNISKIQQWRIYQTVSLCLICEQVNILNQENGFFQEGLKVGGPKGKRPFISTEIYCII